MGWFGRFRGESYFEEVVDEGEIRPACDDDNGQVFLDIEDDIKVVIDGVVIDDEIYDAWIACGADYA
ncbi:hypothetical protein ACFRCG_29235 [Embleya sp. NPDC056575]|uniref:hypothetical protein n=1 Tax=unclassified Embleya TaxID=2699296 RepID=UPI0036A20BCC